VSSEHARIDAENKTENEAADKDQGKLSSFGPAKCIQVVMCGLHD